MAELVLPCPFCGASLEHIESFAYDPPILCHEYHHPVNDCWMSGRGKTFDYDIDRMARWITRWNRRAANAAPVTEATPTDAVPSEPTPEMLYAGYRADCGTHETFEEFMRLCPGWREDQRPIWRAMLEVCKNK